MGGLHDLAGVRRVSWGGDGGGARDGPPTRQRGGGTWCKERRSKRSKSVCGMVPPSQLNGCRRRKASCGPGARSGPAMAWPSDRVRRWCGAPGDGMSHSGTWTRIRRDHQRAGRPEHPLRLPGGHDQRPSLLQHVR